MGDILLCKILRYKFFYKEDMVSDLSELYQKMTLPNLSEEFRFRIFKQRLGIIKLAKEKVIPHIKLIVIALPPHYNY